MSIEINRKSGVPLYIQIKRYITTQITDEVWRPGYKLPTEREMANMVGVSRNTVSTAYKELEDENLLISRQGKGTFVVEEVLSAQKGRLTGLLEEAVSEAVNQGYSHQDIMSIVDKMILKRIDLLRRVHILFIECNTEQVDFFAQELSMESGIYVEPLVLADIDTDPQSFQNRMQQFDFIVTTFFHYEEVKELVGDYDIDVMAISLEPQLETMIKIARLDDEDRLGLVCISDNFAEKVQSAIRTSGINQMNLPYTTSRNLTELKTFISGCDFILTSPGRKKEVMAVCEGINKDAKVIEFVYRPDVGSVNMLKSAVLSCQNRSDKER